MSKTKRVAALVAASVMALSVAAPAASASASASATYGSPASAKRYARQFVSAHEFRCLDHIWTNESSWRYRATNPSSGAYGIPQALPPGKMASAGRDWRTNYKTQIRWGLRYIKGRYGSPCAAWAFWQRHDWY